MLFNTALLFGLSQQIRICLPSLSSVVSQQLPKSSTAISLNPSPRLGNPNGTEYCEVSHWLVQTGVEDRGGDARDGVEGRNEELQREIRSGEDRKDGLRRELERVRARLRVAEEAEEWLCVQLGELEALAAEQDREYRELTQELAQVKSIVSSSTSSSSES